MALLGFTVFREKILDGSKTQTIRRLRKHPVTVGDRLYLYWHLRRKDCVKLGESVCSETFFIEMFHGESLVKCLIVKFDTLDVRDPAFKQLNADETEQLARRDGFTSAAEMMVWFQKHYPRMDDLTFQVIRW